MKVKAICFLATGLALTGLSAIAYADNGYFSAPVQPNGSAGNNGYSSSGSQQNTTYRVGKSLSVTVNPANKPQFDRHSVYGRGGQRFRDARWVNTRARAPIPQPAVAGGGENNHVLYICRAFWRGGIHPGKVVSQQCHISYGGKEISLSKYQVLVSDTRFGWVNSNRGFVPGNAIQGGFENNHKLFICQAAFNGGMHPGKVIGQNCNIAWGGNEVSIPEYNVLVG